MTKVESILFRRVARPAVLALLLLCSACATTTGQKVLAVQRLDAVWARDNAAIRSQLGERTIKATPDQTYRAAKAALIAVGLTIDEGAATPPSVSGSKTYPAGALSWSPAVKQAEEARTRQVFIEALGPVGATLSLNPLPEQFTGSATVKAAAKGETLLVVDLRSTPLATACAAACLTEMPPTALRAAYFEYWTAFDEELAEVKAEDEARAAAVARARKKPPPRPPRKPRATRPPSDWTPPPRDWTPPPK